MAKTKWLLDAAHSEVQFKVRHYMVSWVTGSFGKFDASVETEGEDMTTALVQFTADLSSISTNNDQRDLHLKSSDFFDAKHHPQITFESHRLEKQTAQHFKLHGVLTMRGNTKPIVLNVEFGGVMHDPWGKIRAGFSLTGKINRKDFGVSFSMLSETGSVLLGEEVTLMANAEFIKQSD